MKTIQAILATLLLATAAAAEPTVSVGSYEVVVSGLSAGKPSYWLGFGRGVRGVRPALLRWEETIPADAAGQAVLAVPNGVPPLSMWCVVDGWTGEFAVVSPSDSAWKGDLGGESRAINKAPEGTVGLELLAREVSVLMVRAGGGAWHGRAADGGSGDQDQAQDGGVATHFSDLVAIGSSGQSPVSSTTQDTVIAVDPETFRFWVWQERGSKPGQEAGR